MSLVSTARTALSRSFIGAVIVGTLAIGIAGTSFAAPGGNPGGPNKPVADLALTAGASTATVPVFRSFGTTLAVRNIGPDTASSVSVTSTLPAGLAATSASFTVAGCAPGVSTCTVPATNGTCTTGATLKCTLGKLNSGVTATISVTVRASTAGAKSLSFAIAGSGTDPVAANNTTRIAVKVDSCSVRGTAGIDTLRGTGGRDALCGLGGNDVLIGNGGDDVLVGGLGNDRLRGGYGNDLLRGDAGIDNLVGGPGADILRGGVGFDVLSGENGNDSLFGDAGNDRLTGGLGLDRLIGGYGADTFSTRDGVRDTLSGGFGIDRARLDRGVDAVASIERTF